MKEFVCVACKRRASFTHLCKVRTHGQPKCAASGLPAKQYKQLKESMTFNELIGVIGKSQS